MRIRHIRSPLLALVVAAAFGTACLPVQAMTDDQARALALSATRANNYLFMLDLMRKKYDQAGDLALDQVGDLARYKDAAALAALAQLKDAARNGDATAQYWLGFWYATNLYMPMGDAYAQAAYWYRKAAEQGKAEAQNELGVLYTLGKGVPRDNLEANSWYSKAAEQGLAVAQNNLGLQYALGRGMPRDDLKAAYWFRKAAEQGFGDAQYWLGVEYEAGEGVPQDFIIAYALYNLSIAGDSQYRDEAENDRNHLAEKMTPRQIAAGQELTRRMMKIGVLKAIDAIHPGSRAR
jgi:TPR repeat protein